MSENTWTKHDGGKCPLPSDTYVAIKVLINDGRAWERGGYDEAGWFDMLGWWDGGKDTRCRITDYRVVAHTPSIEQASS